MVDAIAWVGATWLMGTGILFLFAEWDIEDAALWPLEIPRRWLEKHF